MRVPQFTRGLAVGATAVYVLDRARGRRRRATLRDRVNHFAHQVEKAAGRTVRDARNRGREALAVVARAVTNVESKRLVGSQAGPLAVVVQNTMEVAVPIDQVFDFFSRFENFPRFMAHLIDVRQTSDRKSHWLARGPAGTPFHWVTEITSLEPNRKLAWRSAGGASIQNAGVVRFDPTPDGGTRVDIRLSYNRPAGAVGHGLAALLGADPQQSLDEDMVHFRSLIEHGRPGVYGEGVERVELSAT